MNTPHVPSLDGEATRQAEEDRRETMGLDLETLSGVRPQPVRYLVPNLVALGKLLLCAGEGGNGKSTIWLDAVAKFSTGKAAFGLNYDPPDACDVLLMSAEDDAADTIVPRLLAAGADLDRIHRVAGVKVKNGKPAPFTFTHFEALDAELERRPKVKVVIIDPAGSFIGGSVDDHKDAELRQLLDPLARLAAERGVAIVLIKHFNKSPDRRSVQRITGSVAWVNACRAVFAVAPDPDDEDLRLFLPLKGNLGKRPRGLAFRLEELSRYEADRILTPFADLTSDDRALLAGQLFRVRWCGFTDRKADEVLNPRRTKAEPSRVELCAAWLKTYLGQHAWPDAEVEAAAKKEGFTVHNFRDAKRQLKPEGLRSKARGFQAVWWIGFGDPAVLPERPVLPPAPVRRKTSKTGQPSKTGVQSVQSGQSVQSYTAPAEGVRLDKPDTYHPDEDDPEAEGEREAIEDEGTHPGDK